MIDERELSHRLCNGFISHDGMVDGRFTDVFEDAGITWAEISNNESQYGKMIELVIQIIESVPKIEGVKRGRWVENTPQLFECSECGVQKFDPSNYCPNCGARMGEGVTTPSDSAGGSATSPRAGGMVDVGSW